MQGAGHMMCRNVLLVVALLTALMLPACGGKPTPDVQAIETQVAARIFATQTASVPVKTPTPPHAPPIVKENKDEKLYGENVMVVQVPAGKRVTLKVMDLWKAPGDAPLPACAEAYLRFTWIVRQPYPDGRGGPGRRDVHPHGKWPEAGDWERCNRRGDRRVVRRANAVQQQPAGLLGRDPVCCRPRGFLTGSRDHHIDPGPQPQRRCCP